MENNYQGRGELGGGGRTGLWQGPGILVLAAGVVRQDGAPFWGGLSVFQEVSWQTGLQRLGASHMQITFSDTLIWPQYNHSF